MFRCVISAARTIRPLAITYSKAARLIRNDVKPFSTRTNVFGLSSTVGIPQQSLLQNKQIMDIASNVTPVPFRTVTKFSMKKGKRKTVKAALRRFLRLDWGGWIRPKVGRQKKLWKKTAKQKRRLKEHVFCNGTQSIMLDKMVTKFWKRPKYYVDDPYAPYHTREEFHLTRKKPEVRN